MAFVNDFGRMAQGDDKTGQKGTNAMYVMTHKDIRQVIAQNKKFKDGKNLFVLPTGVGAWQQVQNVPWDLVHAAVRSVLRADTGDR